MLTIADAFLCAIFYALLADSIGKLIFDKDEASLLCGLKLTLLVITLRLAFKVLLAVSKSKLTYKLEELLRRELIERLFNENPLSYKLKGSLNTVVLNAVHEIIPYFTVYLFSVRAAIVIPLILWGAIVTVSPLSALILALLTPLIPLFMILIGKGTQKLNDRQWLQIARLSQRFLEAVSQINVIKLFNLEKKELKTINFMTRRWRLETMQILKTAFLSALALEFFTTVGIAFCAITLGFAIYEDGFDYRYALFVILCAPEFFLPLRNLGQNFHVKLNAMGAISQIMPWFEKELDTKAKDDKVANLKNINECTKAPFSLSLNKVTLVYADGRVGISDFSAHFKAGKITALKGKSGSGKSTILKALCGFLTPTKGDIHLNAVDYQQLDKEDLLRHITYIPQQPRLFYGSLRDNLVLGADKVSDEKIYALLHKLQASFLIEKFSDGLNHLIGDDGHKLSGGQARIIALVRALLKESDIILLDEPTASLDADLEQKVFVGFLQNFKDKTVIMAAHHPYLLELADEVVDLEH